MKPTIFLALLFASLSCLTLHAQTPQATPPPLPKGPIPARAPAICAWLISVTSGTESPVKVPDAQTTYASRTLVRKAGDVRDELSVDASGAKSERWVEGDLEALVPPGGGDPAITAGGGLGINNGYTDYSKSDFPDFSWCTRHNYIGVQIMEGIPCFVFQDGVADLSGGTPSSSGGPPAAPTTLPNTGSTAYISQANFLPVLLDLHGIVSLYQMETANFSQLTPPQNVQDAFDRQKRMVEMISRPAAAP